TCDDNQKQFKGVFMRYMMDAADTTHDPRYVAFVDKQAASVWNDDRNAGDQLGGRWSGADSADSPNVRDWRTQASALSALIAAIPRPAPNRSLAATLSPAQPVVIPNADGPTKVALKLGVSATGPAGAPLGVQVTADAPTGWAVAPAKT